MRNKLLIIMMTLLAIVTMGCTSNVNKKDGLPKKENIPVKNEVKDDEKVKNDEEKMNEFKSLTDKDADLNKTIKFIDENIKTVSDKNASIMINKLEELQKLYLVKLEDKFASGDTLQNKLMKIDNIENPGIDMDKVDVIKDKELKDMLIEIRDQGYRIETTEGMYFPIINYEFYKRYAEYVTDDVKDYIGIMSKESNEAPAKDAGLVISWKELVTRALVQEKFIVDYPESKKTEDIKRLYKNYRTFIFRGLDNTPLFNYDTKLINDEAKGEYMEVVKKDSKSKLITEIKAFVDILKKNEYKLTDEVEKFRNDKGI